MYIQLKLVFECLLLVVWGFWWVVISVFKTLKNKGVLLVVCFHTSGYFCMPMILLSASVKQLAEVEKGMLV